MGQQQAGAGGGEAGQGAQDEPGFADVVVDGLVADLLGQGVIDLVDLLVALGWVELAPGQLGDLGQGVVIDGTGSCSPWTSAVP